MLVRDLPYHQIFGSVIRPVVSEEKDKLLAIASLQELSNFIPNIDVSKNIDLLPIAFDACVINRGNKNGDLIDTETALSSYKTFIHKFIDTEHNRQKVIGVILSSYITEFGTNRLLREEDVIGSKEPFNITLGGVLWRAVNEKLCDLVEESNDPTSEHFMQVSASWELGFSDYKIVEMDQGNKNLSEGTVIDNPEFIHGVKKYLKCFGGSGVKDGKSYFRLPSENLIAMGIGLTEKPAADVMGIVTKLPEDFAQTQDISSAGAQEEKKSEIFISREEKINVIQERESIMKITSIADITDENLKQCTASVITQFIAEELKKASDTFTAEKQQQAQANQTLQATTETLKATVQEMQASLENLKQEREARIRVDAFNARMSEVLASYELPEDVTKIVVEDLKALASDEAFAAWKTKAETLFKPYSKAAIKAAKCKADDEEAAAKAAKCKADDEMAAAKKAALEKKGDKKDDAEPDKDGDDKKDEDKDASCCDNAKASVTAAVENALDNAEKSKENLPNSSSVSAPGLKEKFASAFAEENFVIKK